MRFILFIFLSFTIFACNQTPKSLPYLGKTAVSGQKPVIPPFTFTDQMGRKVTNQDLKGKVYVADFFFTSCPTICPMQTANMLKIYNQVPDPDLMFLSHSIDPRHDSVPVLKKYADELGINHDRWRFITGPKEEVYKIAEDYMSTAMEDKDEPGGYIHSGYLLLVDRDGHLRAYCDGTNADSINVFIPKIKLLLGESHQ
jgi:protein SCO1/2